MFAGQGLNVVCVSVKVKYLATRIPRLGYRIVGPQVHFLHLTDRQSRSTNTLSRHAPRPSMLMAMALSVSAPVNAVLGELAALIGVEDSGLPWRAKASSTASTQNPASIVMDRPPGQNPPAEPVDDGGEIDEAARHRNVGYVHGPDLVGTRRRQIAQQIRIILCPGAGFDCWACGKWPGSSSASSAWRHVGGQPGSRRQSADHAACGCPRSGIENVVRPSGASARGRRPRLAVAGNRRCPG